MIITNETGLSLYKHLKNKFFSKNANYAQVEAVTLVKKYNETVRHFALKVQQLKGWCNEKASTTNLIAMKMSQKDYQKTWKILLIKDK